MKNSAVKEIKNSVISLILRAQPQLDIAKIDKAICYPPDVELGDLCINCFILLQKESNPGHAVKELAQKIADFLSETDCFMKVSALGPYVNITLKRNLLFQSLCREIVTDNSFGENKDGCGKMVVVEFSSPNTNKPLHLGHVRNNTIGVAVANLLEANGYSVARMSLVNDRGIHICKSMLAYTLWGNGSTPESTGRKGDHFVGDWYVRYNKEVEKDPCLKEKAAEMLRRFEASDPEIMELWKKMNKWVYKGFGETYYSYTVAFNARYYESETCMLGRDIVDDGLKRKIFYRDSMGAVLCDLPEKVFGLNADGSSKKVTLLRADGTSVYLTQDLGTAVRKSEEFRFHKSIYVVGSEQTEHFKYLFHIIERLGYFWAKDCHHLSYGMVYLPEGKMKSREGTVVDADDLLEDVRNLIVEELRERSHENSLGSDELYERSLRMALAAIKVYLLKNSSANSIKFDPRESISFDGFTGVYILYSYTRALAILRKGGVLKGCFNMQADFSLLGNNVEVRLAHLLFQFPEAVRGACLALDPSKLVRHIYEIARTFNKFYTDCPVISCVAKLQDARLELVKATVKVLEKGLQILGIETVDRM